MPPPVFLNIDYIFYQVYAFFVKSYLFVVNFPWATAASYIKPVAIAVIIFSVIGTGFFFGSLKFPHKAVRF